VADPTVYNGTEPLLKWNAKTTTGTVQLQGVELKTGTESGAVVDLARAEDSGHTSGDMGVMMLAVRKDTAAALATTDQDYIPLTTDSLGRLHVVLDGANAMPGSLSTTDSVSSIRTADAVMYGGVSYPLLHFKIDRATAADGAALVNLSGTKKIVLISCFIVFSAANTAKWVSSTSNSSGAGSNTDLSPFMSFAANSMLNNGASEYGHVITGAGGSLKLELSLAQQASGYGTAIQVA
jgi:hypothetical protein